MLYNFAFKTKNSINMMTTHFPITSAIGQDADTIMIALNSRSAQIKSNIDSQGIFKKITIMALKILGLISGITTASSIPVTVIVFTVTPLTIGAAALVTTITCLTIYMWLDPRSPGELIVKDQWKSLFEALRKGNGKQILDTCQELAKQKEKRASSFNQCLGAMPASETTSFFHKTCLVGYLQIAMEYLRNGDEEQAKSNAHMALSHFGASGFSQEIENFVSIITLSPRTIRELMEKCQAGKDLHALDYLVAIATGKVETQLAPTLGRKSDLNL